MPIPSSKENQIKLHWNSPVPYDRWRGFRSAHPGNEAFSSKSFFEVAQASELLESLPEQDLRILGRLLKRGQKNELEIFVRTHGANPIFDPGAILDIPIAMAKADAVNLSTPATDEAIEAIIRGDVVHVFFQAGEATRFEQGPFYSFNPVRFAQTSTPPEWSDWAQKINDAASSLPKDIQDFIVLGELGPKQILMLRSGLRRIVHEWVLRQGWDSKKAQALYTQALSRQKLLFFVSRQNRVADFHDEALRKKFSFFGFEPENIVTIEQDLIPGLFVSDEGDVSLMASEGTSDAAGHLYALLQATRPADFSTYSSRGQILKPKNIDALQYLLDRGGKIMSIIRINDMDRHSTEIINAKALSYALSIFKKGYANAIESVANPEGQKGGTGIIFADTEVHYLTETHENSFPVLARSFESALEIYKNKNQGQHPAYNAMRQWSDLRLTREALLENGGRIVFVPRQKLIDKEIVSYLGVDMPMGDLSLLSHCYRSRMFQFVDSNNHELNIHDMKKRENLPIAFRTILHQLADPFVLASAKEIITNNEVPFILNKAFLCLYGAPSPELNSQE